MNVWKIASRWNDIGTEESSIIDIFRKYNIVFAGRQTDYIKQSVEIGDYIAITEGITIVSVGIVLSEPTPITEFEFEEKDIESERFDYESWVIAFKVMIFDLDKNDFLDYKSGTFNQVQGELKAKIEKLVNEKFFIPSIDIFTKIVMPFAIKQLEVINYQGIKKLHISNIPVDAQWIFLTGENGIGKTSILQSIVIALFGAEDEDKKPLDRKENIRTKIEFKDGDENRINILHNKFKKFINFVAYGPARLNKKIYPTNPNRTFNLFNTYGELLDIEDKMIKWQNDSQQHKFFESTRAILLTLMSPQIIDIKIERIGAETFVKYGENERSELKTFNELAAGFKNIVSMVGDMIIRLSENQKDLSDFSELAGFVIIDEFDNHLHSKWQRELVKKLTELFPKVQFIVSTHSPIPLLGAPPDRTVILNVNRTKEEGITVRRLTRIEKELPNLLPNVLLTSPVFGIDDLRHSENKEIENVRVDDDDKDRVKFAILEKEIDELFEQGNWENHELFKDL